MLRVLGNPKRLCDGVTRRDLLTAGAALGLTLPAFLRAQGRTPPAKAGVPHDKHFGRAKSCILLFLYGSPSQLELADQKPDAPVEVRGELKSIRSTLPGCDVCELLPHTSRVMHNVTVVRSVTHPYPLHGVAYATSAIPEIDVPIELSPHDSRHWPFIGSTVAHLEQRRDAATARKPVPDNIALPFPFSSQRSGEVTSRRPVPGVPGQPVQPALHHLPRQGDEEDHQDADRPHHRVRRAVRGHVGGLVLRARRRADGRPHTRPDEHPQVAARPDGGRAPLRATSPTRATTSARWRIR